MERRIKLHTLNKHITCEICSGYFIDATTVTECLHTCKCHFWSPKSFYALNGQGYFVVCTTRNMTFVHLFVCWFSVCKSCLVKHLEENNTCPRCGNVIHQSHPLQYISFDRTMQDIVYKLVPNLQMGKWLENKLRKSVFLNVRSRSLFESDEMKREREFYKSRNLPNPKDQPLNNEDDAFDRLNEPHVESDYHRQDEQVNVCLECMTNNLSALKRRFLRCSSQATITHLKKFVAKKVLNGIERYKEVK